ncbi:hypothetical protein F5Y16DRAFT_191799 [Xylariaceae sp. FL0255]|nr:hypothetical protein F5Y16DRAFT_191799 [Xylariaceae sp. FL0255]
MSATRPLLSCSHCRSLVLSAFSASSSTSRRAAASTISRLATSSSSSPSSYYYYTQPVRSFSNPSKPSSADDTLPWYLQVDPPTHVAPIELPPLPEVPHDGPKLLHSLLEYAAEEMGLDDLTLLDLRKLNPPPALGPNLFMLFGTARSERHLNVSAGRLVRWLRAKHRVHADAAGLLGPNERKTKLRRKARRAKLLGTMGTDDADDGITTGWVCVNLGTVDGSKTDEVVVGADGKLAGFGVSNSGSTIVFQLMTESRRLEMDLETLWTRALNRSIASSASETNPNEAAPTEMTLSSLPRRPSPLEDRRGSKPPDISRQAQSRTYTTSAQITESPLPNDPFQTATPQDMVHTLTHDPRQKLRVLDLIRASLSTMNAEQLQGFLGAPSHSGSPVVELMRLATQTLPPAQTWSHRLALYYRAGEVFSTDLVRDLNPLVQELRIYAVQPTRDEYLQLLVCILSSNDTNATHPDYRHKLALDVISTMYQRNQSVMASDVLVAMISGESRFKPDKDHDRNLQLRSDELLNRIETLLFRREVQLAGDSLIMDESLMISLMRAYVQRQSWDRFWNVWRLPAKYSRPRSAAMYQHLFELTEKTQALWFCRNVLRRCLPEMLVEQPPVRVNKELFRAILACIQVVDSTAAEHAESLKPHDRGPKGRLANREFVRLVNLLKLEAQAAITETESDQPSGAGE